MSTERVPLVARRHLKVGDQHYKPGDVLPSLDERREGLMVHAGDAERPHPAILDAILGRAQAQTAETAGDSEDATDQAEDGSEGQDDASSGPSEEAETGAEGTAETPDDSALEQYSVGGGWYAIPGTEKRLRKEEALAALAGQGEAQE